MPLRLKVVGWYFVVGGLLSAVTALQGLLGRRTLWLDAILGICLIPIGLGLFDGRSSARRWAVGWLAYQIVVASSLLLIAPRYPDLLSANFIGTPFRTGVAALPYLYVLAPLFAFVSAIILWQLFSAPVGSFIRQQEAVRAAAVNAAALSDARG